MNQSEFEFAKRSTEVQGKDFNCFLKRDLKSAHLFPGIYLGKLRLLSSCLLKNKLLATSDYSH